MGKPKKKEDVPVEEFEDLLADFYDEKTEQDLSEKDKKPLAPLTGMAKIFAIEYAATFDKYGSYEKAGFSGSNPRGYICRLLADPRVQEIIKEEQTRRKKDLDVTVNSVVRRLVNLYDKSLKKDDLATAHRVAVDLGKHVGMWPREVKIKGAIGHYNMNQPLTSEERERVLEITIGHKEPKAIEGDFSVAS